MTSGEKHLTVKIIQRCQVYLINQYLTSKYLLEAMILAVSYMYNYACNYNSPTFRLIVSYHYCICLCYLVLKNINSSNF